MSASNPAEESARSGHGSRARHRQRAKHPLPLWMRIGDNVAELVVASILMFGFLCEGYVNQQNYMLRAGAGIGCAALGIWAAVGFTRGRWDAPEMRISRWIMILFGIAILWTGIQLLPLPSRMVASVSGVWREIQAAYREVGMDFPSRVSLAHSPERGLRSWHQLVAAALFFAGVAQLASRRSCSMRLITMVMLVSIVEGLWGLTGKYFGANRAMGAIFNPNHHAALAVMGLPIYFARMIQWKRFNPAIQEAPLISGTHPMLLFLAIGLAAGLGWLNSLSRGSILFGGSILLIWIIVELVGNWRERRNEDAAGPSSGMIVMAGVGYLMLMLVLTLFLVSSSILENLLQRTNVEDELQGQGRLELWKGVFRALSETPWLGFGLSGTETALNRYTVLPLGTIPIWAHNDYVQVVAELGLPAAALMLVVLAVIVGGLTIQWASQLKEMPWTLGLPHRACIAGVLITLAHSSVDFHLRIPLIGFTFLILLALAISQGALLISPRTYSKLVPFRLPRFRRHS